LYYTPLKDYFFFAIALMHFVQAFTLLPEANLTHWRFGFFLVFVVGLYLPLSFTLFQTIRVFFPQITQTFAIFFIYSFR